MNRCAKCIVATVVSALVAHQPLAALAHANSAFATPLPTTHSATMHHAVLPTNAFHSLGYGTHGANVPAALSHALQLSGTNPKLTFLYSTPVMQLLASGHTSNHMQVSSVTTTPSTNTQTTSNSSTTTGSLSTGVSLNLAAQSASLTANVSSPVTIRIGGTLDGHGVISGGTMLTIKPGQMITPAEYQALMQVQLGGSQTLVINGKGNAASGYLQLDTGDTPSSGISSLVVPRGVTVDTVGYTSSNPFVVTGAVKVFGSLVALQPTSSTGSVLNLGSLNVSSGARVTDILPSNQSYLSSLFNSSSLTLNIINGVTNSGSITSGGTLTINAGGTIANVNSSMPGASPAVISGTNVVLSSTSGNFTNSGSITARSGDVSFKSPNTINLTNTNGQISAQSGNINFRDSSYTGTGGVNVTGGSLLSQNVNVYSGTGNVTINANSISGANNVWANTAHITTAGGTLNIGTQNLAGDPTYYNTAGNVVISNSITTLGNAVAVAAQGNVTLDKGANITTQGGQINLIAGAQFSSSGKSAGFDDTSSVLTVTGGSKSGGSVDLNNASLNSSGTSANGSGGNVNLVAFAGTGANSGTITSSSTSTITTGGKGTGENGSVTVIAGATSGQAVSLGNINTTGGTGVNSSGQPTGNIQIFNSTPVVHGPLTIQNGAITAGSFGPSTNGANYTLNSGSVSTGNLTAGGQHLDVYSGGNLAVGNVSNVGIGSKAQNEITLQSNSSSTFNVGGFGSNSSGSINASGGSTFGAAGGSVTISNNGTGGIKVADLSLINVNANSKSGDGGSVSLLSSNGTVTLGTGTLSANATGNNNGGTIDISAKNIYGIGNVNLNANGSGSGNGGTVNLTANGKDGSITSIDRIDSSATSGTAGGNGGTVSYTAGGNISVGKSATIDVAVLGKNGNGGNISLVAGTGGNGNVYFNNALSANGAGTGNGGNVTLSANSASTLEVNGAVSANSGSNGSGGQILITNNGTGSQNGGILIANNLSATGTNGNGGYIAITSQGATPGKITFDSNSYCYGAQSVNVSAYGLSNTNGGSISIKGASVDFEKTVLLSANEQGSGQGGSISTIANGINGSIYGNSVIASATGGSWGTTSGNGGTVEYTAAGNVELGCDSSINVGALGQNGNGGIIHLEAGTGGNGDVYFTNTLSANGTGTGNGGQIVIDARSANALVISQTVSANAGNKYGTGGTISIDNDGSGNKNGGVVIENNLSAYGVNTNGGDITITSQGSTAGKIVFDGKNCGGDQLVNVSAYGTQWGNGGQINITGGSVQFDRAINLTANASGPGTGGLVSVIANGQNGSITGNNVFSSATGGSKGSSGGDGGTVEFTAAGNVSLGGKSSIDVNVLGQNGNGGVIHLEAGTGGNGDVYFSNTLSANGAGTGNGGQIVIDARSGSALVIAQNVSANAGDKYGVGGTINIDNDGSGGKNGGVLIENNLSAYGVNTNGGDITITSQGSSPGKIVFDSKYCSGEQLVNVNAYGTQWGNGGQINITGGSVQFDKAIDLTANASGPGTGGLVSVIANGENGSITGNNVFSSATGGSKGSSGGDGGTVEFTAAGNVALGGKSSIDVNVLGQNGNGGVIHLEAGTGGNGDVYFSNTLSANGAGTGNGGQIVIDARSGSALVIAQNVSANAGDKYGRGGTINIDNDGSGGKNGGVLIENNLSAYGVNTNGGDITVTSQGSTPGKIVFDSKYCSGEQLVNVNAYGTQWGNGGQINITGGSVQFDKSIVLTANASGPGTGGLVSVIANGENGSITGNNVFSSATGGSKGSSGGDGGTVEFTAAGNVALGGKSSIDVNVLGQNGNGGVIHLEAGTGGNGDVYFANTLSANGAGNGNGGQIVVDARSGNALVIAQNVSANAGDKYGVGGTINIDNDGSGGKNGGVLIENNLSAYGVNTNGGDITVTSQGSTPGKIVFDSKYCGAEQLVNVNAYGTNWGNGGQINITGGSVQFDNSIALTANASGPGTGGLVSVIANGLNGSIYGNNVFSSATGGSKGSSGGDGGTVEFTAAGNIGLGGKSSIDVNVLGQNGNGGVIHLIAGTGGNGDVYFSNTLSANGAGNGNGGHIVVDARSGNALVIAQNVSANAGDKYGLGGTINIDNDGSGGKNGGVLIENNLSAYGVNTNGGDITVTSQGSTPGKIVFDSKYCGGEQLVNVNAYGTQWGNGGQINITGGSVQFDKSILLTANASGPGTGGLVSVIANGENGSITGNNVFSSATGGSKGSTGGDGGTVEFTAAGNIALGGKSSIDVNVLGQNGNGGVIHLIAGTGGNGDVYFGNTLSANGAGVGNGGQIVVDARSGKALVIAQNVSANAGNKYGLGGTINIDNDGSGGKNGGVLIENNLSAYGVNTNGGDITVTSQGSTPGKIVFDSKYCGADQLVNVSAYGTQWGNGGQINITGGSVQFDNSIHLEANASGPGTGGLVSVIANGQNGSIYGNNVFSSATGGSKGSTGGDGGTVEFTAAGNIALGGKSSIDVNVLGQNGNGGVIHLIAGTGGNGDVYFGNTLSANGAGNGNGGHIVVDARSGNALVLAQNVSANAGDKYGIGGTINIDNDGSGGKNGGVVIEKNLSAYGVNTNGGDITVTSQGSTPGKIVFDGKDCGVQLVNVSAYGTQWGNGGQINITGGSVQFDKSIDLTANASGPGTGGLVSVIANGQNGSITGKDVFSSATGGSKGSKQGDGGTVEFTAAGNIKLGSKSSIDVNVLGVNGNGGIIHLEAGTGGNGNVYFSNTLSANGKGTGNGGQILVSARSGSALTLNQDISANGGSSGSGGNITIQNSGSGNANGGIKITNDVSANGYGGGNGGNITITAQGPSVNGVVTFGNSCCHVGEITANASGNNSGNGGTITITGSSVKFDQREVITANGANFGSGGTVGITAINGNVIAQCPITILANGGASGGAVTVTAYHNVDLDNGGEVGASATNNGSGGVVSITAGTSGKGNDYLDVEVLANGSDKGNGGCIQISAQSQKQLVIDAPVEANSGKSSGNGGTVLIYNTGSNGSNGGIKIDASLLATGTGGGNGGIIGVYAGPSSFFGGNGFGNVVIDEKCGGVINASATGFKTGNGGAIVLIGSNVEFKGSETISANGSGSGNGGLILVGAATGSITSNGDTNFSATGGSKGSSGGNGGTVALLADKNVDLKGTGHIDVNALGKNGNGGNIGLVAGLGGNGNVYTNESLSANGVGKGNGGNIYVSAESGSTLVVKQDVSANGGSSGSGGTITIKNLGSGWSNGGIQINDNVTANGNGGGNGGTILITAQGFHSDGVVTFGNGCCHVGEITANANGGNGNGGTVTITGSSVHFDQRETITANGANNGVGGTISITALTGSVIAECPINIIANGGLSGGTINVSAQRNVDLDHGGNITADGTKNGNGGHINVTAGKGGNGTFDLNTTISANGAGNGFGGFINLLSSGSGTSIVDANVEANGGTSGAGGGITITNIGSCNSNGGLSITGDVTANGTGGHNGGAINISAIGKHDGAVNFYGKGDEVEANAKGSGNGGAIYITGSSVTFHDNEKVAANGGKDGTGGVITIYAQKGSVTADEKIVIVAKGGVGGGTIQLFAKKNIDLENGGRIVASATKDGNGGTILAIAGLNGNGTFSSNANIKANGADKGNGGSISLESYGSGTSNVTGNVSANSGDKSGKGGTILIQNLGTACGGNGGILIGGNISATGSGGDKGGDITINAGGKNPGNVTFDKKPDGSVEQITVNATGTKTANGGKISVTGNNINFNDALAFSANAAGSGNGGSITIEALKGSIDGNAQVSFSATGGSVGSKHGNGGTLTLSAGANISLPNLNNVNVGPLGENGNGGNLKFAAGTCGEGVLQIGTGLNVDGVGKGNGGTIKLSYNDGNSFVVGGTGAGSYVNGNINADATGAGGKGGTVSISNGKKHDLDIVLDGTISAVNTTDPTNTGLYGNLNFINNGSHAVVVIGPGQLLGITNAHGSSVYINPQHIDTQLTTGLITATKGSISLIVDCPTSQIVIPTGSLISTLPGGTDILIQGPTTYNYGTVSSNRNLTFATNNYYGNGIYTANGKIVFEACPGCGPVNPNPPDHHHTGSGGTGAGFHFPHTGGNGQGGPFAGRNNGNADVITFNQTSNSNTIVQNSFVPTGGNRNGNDQFVYSKTATDITEIMNSTNLDQSNVHNGYLEEDEYTRRRSGNSMIEGSKAFNKGTDEQSALIKEGIVWANGTNKEYWNIDKGNILFNPEHDIVVGTHEGDVHIAAGSSVFVMETGHDVYVYNLHQSNSGKVFVTSDKEMIKMDPGGLLVLTKNKVDNFEELDGRCHWIGYSGIQKTEMKNGVNAFSGRFSIPSAFSMVVPLKKMLTSSDNRERQLVDRILKSSVLLSEMMPTNSPFQNGDMSR